MNTRTLCTMISSLLTLQLSLALRAASPDWIAETELYPHVAENGAGFGTSIHVSANEAAIGAPFRDAGSSVDEGVVEVWRHGAGGWQFSDEVTLEDPVAGVAFGFAVAIDGNRLFVGAPFYGAVTGTPESGLVAYFQYFEGQAVPWSGIGGIGGAEGDHTGWSIALDRGMLAIGVPGPCETCGPNSGRAGKASVSLDFDDGAAWANLSPTTLIRDGDRYGHSVAVHRSDDGVAPDLAVVGAPFHDSGAEISGAAYVFANETHAVDGWHQVATLAAPTPGAQEMFGLSVAIGADRVLVGAPGRDAGGTTDAGSVFVYVPDGAGGWQQQAELFLSGASIGDRFGTAVAYDAQHGWLVGGAPDRVTTVFGGTGQTGVAAVFRYDTSVSHWFETAELFSHDLLSIGQYAGAALAIANGRVYVGAPNYDANPNNGISDSGRVLVFAPDEIFDDDFE